MTGYVRKDTTNNIADGNVINAADLDAEFDGVQDAFNASTGHNHDGTSGEGAPITALGPTQDVTISAILLAPKTNNTVDIGSSALKFKDLFLAGNGSIGGTLAVTGVATFTAQPILSSLTASRAVFSDGSKGLVSNAITGTGNVVMSASPTLTGTIDAAALTASGNLTLSGGTANGVAYLNGSKVVTSGSALTFDGTTLNNSGAFGTSTAALTLKNSSAANSSNIVEQQFFAANSFSGLDTIAKFGALNPSAGANNYGTFYWSLANAGSPSEQMRLTSTGLGIGTSSPAYKLDVSGSARIGTGTTTPSLLTMYPSASAKGWQISANNYVASALEFTCATANGGTTFSTPSMLLDSSGNLGIGTSSPASKLHVESTSSESVRIGYSSTKTARLGVTSAGDLQVYAYDSAVGYKNILLAIDSTTSAGNVGIGTSSPVGKIHAVASSAGATSLLERSTASTAVPVFASRSLATSSGDMADGFGPTHAFAIQDTAAVINPISEIGAVREGADNSGGLVFRTYSAGTATTQMRLDKAGNLGIGKTPTDKPLEIYASASPALRIQNSTTGTGANDGLLLEMSGSNINFYNYEAGAIVFGTSATERARIDSNGNLLVGTTSAGDSKVVFSFPGTVVGLTLQDSVDNSNAYFQAFRNSGGTIIGSVTRVTTTNAVVYNTTSDYRLKTVTGAVSGQGARIDALKPIDYQWKEGGQQARGFLAHEFQAVYPNSVTGDKDAVDAAGNPVYQAMQASTAEVIADLVAEIQSLRKRLADAGIA